MCINSGSKSIIGNPNQRTDCYIWAKSQSENCFNYRRSVNKEANRRPLKLSSYCDRHSRKNDGYVEQMLKIQRGYKGSRNFSTR